MSTRELPYRWAKRMEERGFSKERGSGPSIHRLAQTIGVHTSTVTRALTGQGEPSAETIAKIAGALGADTAKWLGAQHSEEWMPPAESSLLTDRQRKAVEEIIRAMTERREDVTADAAPTNQAEVSSAKDELAERRQQDETPEEQLPWASHPRKGRESTGRRMRREMDEVGEESQDPGEDS